MVYQSIIRPHGTVDHGTTVHHRTTIPQHQAHGTDFTVPWSTTTLRYRHGTATRPLRYRPHRTAALPPRHRPHGTAGTASKVLPRYRHGTTTVLPPRHRPADTATLPRYHHGTATVPTLMVLPRDSHGTEPMVLPRCRFQGIAKVLPPRYRPPTALISWYSHAASMVLSRCCHGTNLRMYCHGTEPHGTATVPPRYRPNGTAKVPTFQGTATVPTLVVLPRYRQGTAPMVYCQGTASKVLRRYRYGTAAVAPRSLRPKVQPGTATPTVPLSWYCHGTAPMVPPWYHPYGTATVPLPRYFHANAIFTVPPRYLSHGSGTVAIP